MSSSSVCSHTRDETNQTPAMWPSDFVNHSSDYTPTPISPTYEANLAQPPAKTTII